MTPTSTIINDISPDGVPITTSAAPVKPESINQPNIPERKEVPLEQPKAELQKPVEVKPSTEATKQEDAPKADDKSKEVSIEDFVDAGAKSVKVDKKPDEPVTKEVETTEPKKISREELVKQDKATRDIKDFEDDKDLSTLLVDDMSRKAFDKVVPILKEHKQSKAELAKVAKELEELKKNGPQLPESYYEHQDGYLLDPEFRNAVRATTLYQQIHSHWQQQLAKVTEGAPEFEMINYNPQTQQLEITGKMKADRMSEAQLLQYINFAQNNLTQATANQQAIAQTHTIKATEANKGLKQFVDSTFAFFHKPEHKEIYEPLIKEKMDMFPAHKSNPLLNALAHSLTLNQTLHKLLQDAAKEKQGQAAATNGNGTKQENTRRAQGPSAEEIAGDGAVVKRDKNGEDVTMDDFRMAKM